jgi:hypothetical protein
MAPAHTICPFLGLREDASSSLAFPSDSNYCHRCQPKAAVIHSHQEEFCLNGKYHECPVFSREEIAPLPHDLRAHHEKKNAGKNPQIKIIIAAWSVVAIILILGWQVISKLGTAPAIQTPTVFQPATSDATDTPQPTITPLPFTPTKTPTPTLHLPFFGSITVTFTPSTTPSMTPTRYIRKHGMDVPIGTDRKFIIHRLELGDRLEPYAEKYNTSIEAIQALNYFLHLKNPIYRDALVIFPIGFTDVTKLHILTIYQIPESERGENYEYLVPKFKFDMDDFKYYNGINEPGERPLVGDYYLIPQRKITP